MRHKPAALAIALFSLAIPLGAQTPALDLPTDVLSADVAAGLAQLNRTLEEIQKLLAGQLETQTLDLLLKRAQLVSTEVANLDSRLRQARSTRNDLADRMEEYEDFRDRFAANSNDVPPAQAEEVLTRHRRMMERTARRLSEAEAEVVDLETRLGRKQQNLDDWQELLDRRLGGV